MNILYLCDEYPPGRHGGIGTSVQMLARQMVKTGHRVVVAGLYSPGYGGDDEFDDEGVKVYRYRWGMEPLLEKNQKLTTRIIKNLLKISGLLDRDIKASLSTYKTHLEEIITKYGIDIVEMPDYNDYIRHCRSFIPFPSLSVPVVIKMNGSITYFQREAGKTPPLHVYKMERCVISQAVAVAAVSRYTAHKSTAYFDYVREIQIIPNGIATDKAFSNVKRNPLQVIFTGTLVQKKGIYQLAKAWNNVIKQQPEARLLVLGKGKQHHVSNLLTTEARSTVSFMGYASKDILNQHLGNSSIAVFPSYAEAFALAPLEAMACGTAVINSNRTSGPELIDDGINGLLVDPDDADQITLAIIRLLKDTGTRARLADAGQRKVSNIFDIVKIAEQNIKFYNNVLSAK